MNIRQKFIIALAILLAAVVIPGIFRLHRVDHLGKIIDVILRENYQSVVICQNVTDALERIDSLVLFNFSKPAAPVQFDRLIQRINQEWQAEMGNLTVPGEKERALEVRNLLNGYFALIPQLQEQSVPFKPRWQLYKQQAYPGLVELKSKIQDVLTLNQNNMLEANNIARAQSAQLFRQEIALLLGYLLFAAIFIWVLVNWIQKPLRKLIAMTNEIATGNLALVLDSKSNDEIGQLSRSFNAMAIALRSARQQLEVKLHRSERLNRDVFFELPTPIAVFDTRNERIELATESARKFFRMTEGRELQDFNCEWLTEIFNQVKDHGGVATATAQGGIVQYFIDGKEFFFQPTAVPLPANAPVTEISGVVVILKDVTLAHEQQELKRSVISTVSHQLRTPLTSLQMSIYLLLEEKCGPLTPEQLDLVATMRDDSNRLTEIIGDLLDLNKAARSGAPEGEVLRPSELLEQVQQRFQGECGEKEIELCVNCDAAVPNLRAVPEKLRYVFDNLLSNAVRFTPVGGRIELAAQGWVDAVQFKVTDTGCGMSEEVKKRIFEPFFRAPGQSENSGVGLGLAIVKEIILAHGGQITVQSQENSGTVFVFTLPAIKQEK